jgi:serine/threonine-protein kinase
MSPEQLAGARVDRRADIYSLGATAYALRYGAAPFHGAAEVMRGQPPYFPAARSPEEAYFQHVVARMLAHKPEHRHAHLMVPRAQLVALAATTAPRDPPARTGEHEFRVAETRIRFTVGDIARWHGDAIVNSANTQMTMRSGVGDALRRAGGDELETLAAAGGEQALGGCVLTGPGRLPLRGVIHAVAAWNEVSCIARATQRALLIAEEQGYARLALPALGTGQGRVHLEACADAMAGVLRLQLLMGGSRLSEVDVVLYDAETRARFVEVAAGVLLGGDDTRADHAVTATPAEDSLADTWFGSGQPSPTNIVSDDDGEQGTGGAL